MPLEKCQHVNQLRQPITIPQQENCPCFTGYMNGTIYNNLYATHSNSMSMKTSKTNLYIKGLPPNFNDLLLEQLFPFENKVKSVKAAMDVDMKCKGYGFIDFITEETAEEAKRFIETNYSTYPVKFAKENEKDRSNLYITNIPKEWTSNDSDKLKKIFEKFGEVQSAFIMQEKTSSKTTGIGFVRFTTEQEAESAIEHLENNKVLLPFCNLPLEAKYADKHNPETRKRRNVDSHLKPYPFNPLSHDSPIFREGNTHNISNRTLFNNSKSQDFISLYPILLSPGNNSISPYQNILPYHLMNSYNNLCNPAALWNINAMPYLTTDYINSQLSHLQNPELNSNVNPFIVPTTNLSSLINPIPLADGCGNKNNQHVIFFNNHIRE